MTVEKQMREEVEKPLGTVVLVVLNIVLPSRADAQANQKEYNIAIPL